MEEANYYSFISLIPLLFYHLNPQKPYPELITIFQVLSNIGIPSYFA